jgi:hypothetical protein
LGIYLGIRLQQEFQRLRAGLSDEEVVKSENEKAAIEAKVKQLSGVRSVNNLLEVEANQ